MAAVAVIFLSALGTSGKTLILAQERTTAESIARTQMEYIKDMRYDELDAYLDTVEDGGYFQMYDAATSQEYLERGFEVTVTADSIGAGLQKITVTVLLDNEEILSLEGYKADR
jgi:hypothetical protein